MLNQGKIITFQKFLLEEAISEIIDTVPSNMLFEKVKARSKTDFEQPWKKLQVDFNDDEQVVRKAVSKQLRDEIKPSLKEVYEEFKTKLEATQKTVKGSEVLYCYKSPSSVVDKVQRGCCLKSMDDILRGAIVTRNKDDAEAILEEIGKYFDIHEIRYKEYKDRGDFGYYGAYHARIILSNGVHCEVQIMSEDLWDTKEELHGFYAKNRLKILKDPSIKKDPDFKDEVQQGAKEYLKQNEYLKENY